MRDREGGRAIAFLSFIAGGNCSKTAINIKEINVLLNNDYYT